MREQIGINYEYARLSIHDLACIGESQFRFFSNDRPGKYRKLKELTANPLIDKETGCYAFGYYFQRDKVGICIPAIKNAR